MDLRSFEINFFFTPQVRPDLLSRIVEKWVGKSVWFQVEIWTDL